MSRATFTFGRFNVPTEEGHGKLIRAVQDHAESTGASHYVFPSHSQDAKKNPLDHGQKTRFMQRLFPNANIVSQGKVRTAIDAMKHLEKKGHTHVTMVVGSDRVSEFDSLLNKYRKKEYPGIKSVKVISGGNRDPDAEGAEGMSASKLRDLVRRGKRKEFISHYSDPKLGAELHDAAKKGMQMESKTPIGIFLLGGPGSGKDYVLNNIFSRFDLTEVQIDHILNGAAQELIESNQNIVINGAIDEKKMTIAKQLLEGYSFDHIFVSVTNKVSRDRNSLRDNPLSENIRLEKWYKVDKLAKSLNETFEFKNSLDLHNSSELEKIFFANQIEKLLERIVNDHGLIMKEQSKMKSFTVFKEAKSKYIRRVPRSGNVTAVEKRRIENKQSTEPQLEEKKFPAVAKNKESGLPKKYVAGLSASTAKARKAHWKKMSKYSDKDPRAYEPAPGDATAETKPSKHTLAVRKMMANEAAPPRPNPSLESIAKKHKVLVSDLEKEIAIGVKIEREHTLNADEARQIAIDHLEEIPDYYTRLVAMEKSAKESMKESADSSLAAKAEKSGISLSILRKVYNRGVAAWNSGHRPGTTPQQWGHARVNSYINKGKTYYTADKDLREETKVTGTNCKNCVSWVKESVKPVDKSELNENGGLKPTSKAYVEMAKRVDLISLPGKATVKEKAFCDYEKIQDFVTERMCCAYWDNKDAKRPFKGKADVMEETDINDLFEMQLVGTDEYRKHAIAMTPGQGEIEDAFPVKSPNKKPITVPAKKDKSIVSQYTENKNFKKFSEINRIAEAKKENDGKEDGVDFTPTLITKKTSKGQLKAPPTNYRSTLDGLPIASRFSGTNEEKKKDFMPTPRQIPAHIPPGTKMIDGISQHNVPDGWKRVPDHLSGGTKLVKIKEEVTLEEAVNYHLENKISFTENVFRPGSEMFFEMINEAKRLYAEGKYTPKDDWERDMLNSNIGEIAEFEGQTVVLDYPIEEGLEEDCWKGYVQKGMKKKGDKMVPNCVPVNEIFNTTYPHKSHGTIPWYGQNYHIYSFQVPSKNPEDKKQHTFSVTIGHEQGDDGKNAGRLAFTYHGKHSSNFTPIEQDGGIKSGKQNLTGKFAKGSLGVISTVMGIAKKHAQQHKLGSMSFSSNDGEESSRTKLYDRISARRGGRSKSVGFDFNRTYTVPVTEDADATDGKGIGKPWREGGGGAVYVRDGGSIRKIRFSQSGMKKKYMDPAATRSFVARHRCLTNKDKTSASYWACRWPRFFSNSGKVWW